MCQNLTRWNETQKYLNIVIVVNFYQLWLKSCFFYLYCLHFYFDGCELMYFIVSELKVFLCFLEIRSVVFVYFKKVHYVVLGKKIFIG